MEQTPHLETRITKLTSKESVDALRMEIIALAKQSVRNLFTKRGLNILNDFKGNIVFEERPSFLSDTLGQSAVKEDHIEINIYADEELPVYIHEMIHGYTNTHIHPKKRHSKSGIVLQWVKNNQANVYFLALNEALTEILTDEAYVSIDSDTFLQLRNNLLQVKKDLHFEESENQNIQYEQETKQHIENLSKYISWTKEANSEIEYIKWVEDLQQTNKILEEHGSVISFTDFSRESFQRYVEEKIETGIESLLEVILASEKLIQLKNNLTLKQVERVDSELGYTPLQQKTYLDERALVSVIVNKIAELKKISRESVLEDMKKAYLQGNTLYLRIIGKVLGKDILEIVAGLGANPFHENEADIEMATKLCPQIENEDLKNVLFAELVQKSAQTRSYTEIITKINSIQVPQE